MSLGGGNVAYAIISASDIRCSSYNCNSISRAITTKSEVIAGTVAGTPYLARIAYASDKNLVAIVTSDGQVYVGTESSGTVSFSGIPAVSCGLVSNSLSSVPIWISYDETSGQVILTSRAQTTT